MFNESKGKLDKVRKVILNTHKAPHPYSLFGEENSNNWGQNWICMENKGKLGKVRKFITVTHKAPLPNNLFGEENIDN